MSEEQRANDITPGYEHYQIHQNQIQPEPASEKKPKKKSRNKFGTTVALAVVFGLVAGVVFQGVNLASDKLFHKSSSSTQIAQTETVGTTSAASDDSEADSSGVTSSTGSVAAVASACMPSVVAITSISVQEIPNVFSMFGYGYGGTTEYSSEGSGSGIIVGENDDELLIATNNHVVEDATTLSVCFIAADDSSSDSSSEDSSEDETDSSENTTESDVDLENAVDAKIKGTDTANDLAVIAVQKSDISDETLSQIKIAKLGISDDLQVGDQVVAIGNALGYGQSVTSGWVSALNRTITADSVTSTGLIQTDAAINPGNSGGALLNMNGEVIGINSAKYADSAVEGMGYAIPISKAQPILEDLMNRQTRDKLDASEVGYLGVELADLSSEAVQMYDMPEGAFIIRTQEDSPAVKAGLQKGDIIVKFDGQSVTSKSDLNSIMEYYASGETVDVVIARADNGEYVEQTISVTLGGREADGQ